MGAYSVSFDHFNWSTATYVGRSENLVRVSFGTQKEHGLRDASNPPWIEGKLSVRPVDFGPVMLHRSNFAYHVVSQSYRLGFVILTKQDWVILGHVVEEAEASDEIVGNIVQW